MPANPDHWICQHGAMLNSIDDFADAVAGELRAQRARTNVTVAFLVTATGLSKSAVLHYLNGKRDIPIRSLARLCAAMDVTPSLIVARAEASNVNTR
ncbi:helix-turn-helix transcriptional regulator [Microbacterium lacus]